MIKIFSVDTDNVIKSKFLTGVTDYKTAINKLYPLVNKLDIQRKLENQNFYKRLRQDLVKGCVMPPITLAFILDKEKLSNHIKDIQEYVNENLEKAFILDGIQRINALFKSYNEPDLLNPKLDLKRPLFFNIIICNSMDNLLYRMITLNNGQKPMSANHQIEILLGNIFDFEDLNIKIYTEKFRDSKRRSNTFSKSNIIKSYLAFLSNSVAIDNKKIIGKKMDELLAMKIISSNIANQELEYTNIINLINYLSDDLYLKKWFDNANNIIGFSVGIKKSYKSLLDEPIVNFKKSIQNFEKTIQDLNVSTIKLSKERRNLTKYFISKYEKLKGLDNLELLDMFNENVL